MLKETQHYIIGFEQYCAYCGQSMVEDSKFYKHQACFTYYCSCIDAVKELLIKDQIAILEKSLPKKNLDIYNKLEYDYQLKELNKLFGKD